MINLKLTLRALFRAPSSPSSPSSRWRSASARTPPSSRSSTRCCCVPCRCDRAGRTGQPRRAGAEAGVAVVQPGRRLRRGLQLPDVPRPRARAEGLHRALPRTARSARTWPTGDRPSAAEGMLVSGSYFPVLGVQPGPRPAARPGRRPGPASHPWSCSATSTGARASTRARRPQPDAHRQRPADDDRRRGAAGVRRARRSAPKPQVFVPITMRGAWSPGFKGPSTTAAATGPTCSRGSSPACRSSRRAPALNVPVPRHRQRRRGAAPEGHERPDDDAVQGEADRGRSRRARAELRAPRGEGAALTCCLA